jgi:DNA polymerase-1
VDIETGVEKDDDFTHPSLLLCVGIGYEPNKAIVLSEQVLRDPRVSSALGSLLSRKQVICQNGKFDLQVLKRMGVIQTPNLWADTMLASYVLDERPGQHGLKGMASEHLGAPDYASDARKYLGKGDSYSIIPRPVLYRYNAYDAALTYNLWDGHFVAELESTGLRPLHDRLVGYSNALVEFELDGVKVDRAYLDVLTEQYVGPEGTLNALEEKLKPWVLNPRSYKQVGEVLSQWFYMVPDTQEETLERFLARVDPESEQGQFLTLLLAHRKEQKLYGTYVKGTRKRLYSGRVFPTYLIHGTVTGRLSCRNPNLHNVPRGSNIRRLFVPEEGNTFVQGDYAQAELRVIGCEAEDEWLRGVLSDPTRDIHGEIATAFYGAGNWGKEERVRAKAVVFGLAYGREAPSIATEYDWSLPETEAFIRTFFGQMPGVVAWRKNIIDTVFKEGKALENHFGRKRRFWLITRANRMDTEKEALATIPQSTVLDITMGAAVRLVKSFGSGESAPRLRTTVHDSLMVECRDEDRQEVAAEMKRVMQDTAAEEYSDYIPFPVDIGYGKTWGDLEDMSDD